MSRLASKAEQSISMQRREARTSSWGPRSCGGWASVRRGIELRLGNKAYEGNIHNSIVLVRQNTSDSESSLNQARA